MAEETNKYISVAYQLYTVDNGKETLVEETTEEKPFEFITGFGLAIDAFEEAVKDLTAGQDFEVVVPKEKAFGDYDEEHVLDLDKDMFTINNHFDHEHIYKDAVVPLQNEDGNHFFGHVLDITDDKVKMDLNHPLAGKDIKFKGHVIDHRDATAEEITHMANHLSGEGGGCGGCGGGCGDDHEGCGCGCHHH